MDSSTLSSALLIFSILSISSAASTDCHSCEIPPKSPTIQPPVTVPPVTVPKLPLPPVAVPNLPVPLPPVGTVPKLPVPLPPVGLPNLPVPLPPVGLPNLPVPLPPVGLPNLPVPLPPVGVPKLPVPPVTNPNLPLPPVGPTPTPTPTGKGKPCPSPAGGKGKKAKCPINVLKLGACVDLLGGLVHVGVGDPAVNKCCPVIAGLAEVEAAACLCTTIKLKALNLKIYVPVALELLISCGKTPPPGFTCSI